MPAIGQPSSSQDPSSFQTGMGAPVTELRRDMSSALDLANGTQNLIEDGAMPTIDSRYWGQKFGYGIASREAMKRLIGLNILTYGATPLLRKQLTLSALPKVAPLPTCYIGPFSALPESPPVGQVASERYCAHLPFIQTDAQKNWFLVCVRHC